MKKGLAKFKAFENRRSNFYKGPKVEAELRYFRGVLEGIADFRPPKMSYQKLELLLKGQEPYEREAVKPP